MAFLTLPVLAGILSNKQVYLLPQFEALFIAWTNALKHAQGKIEMSHSNFCCRQFPGGELSIWHLKSQLASLACSKYNVICSSLSMYVARTR
ncbi:MAG: hypothetical protein FJZ94_07040 [Chloroflexi bacterium]|nr:hypothetical protein [Chloroflexota bacterium]